MTASSRLAALQKLIAFLSQFLANGAGASLSRDEEAQLAKLAEKAGLAQLLTEGATLDAILSEAKKLAAEEEQEVTEEMLGKVQRHRTAWTPQVSRAAETKPKP